MKLNANSTKISSSFKDKQNLTMKLVLQVFLSCVCSAEDPYPLFFFPLKFNLKFFKKISYHCKYSISSVRFLLLLMTAVMLLRIK